MDQLGGRTEGEEQKVQIISVSKTLYPFNISLCCIQKVKSVAHQLGAYPGFFSMKQLGVFLLPPGLDASPLQGYPLH